MRFLLPLLFCLSAWAQPEPIWKKLLAVPNPTSPMTPLTIEPTLEYWWVSSDNASNAVVTSWADRIKGLINTNGNASVRPTNASLIGVHFDRSLGQFLTNSGMHQLNTSPRKESYFFVVQREINGNCDILIPAPTATSVGFGFDGIGDIRCYDSAHQYAGPFIPTGKMTDIILMTSFDGVSVETNIFYTNGVVWSAGDNVVNYPGSKPASVGKGGSGVYPGYLTELGRATNLWFTGVQISNLHYYFTNTYHGILK